MALQTASSGPGGRVCRGGCRLEELGLLEGGEGRVYCGRFSPPSGHGQVSRGGKSSGIHTSADLQRSFSSDPHGTEVEGPSLDL